MDRHPKLQATFRRNQCPEYPASPSSSRRFCGLSCVGPPPMLTSFRLTLIQEPDGTGELSAEVNANGFAGKGSAWFNIAEITAFAQALASTYPLQPDKALELKGGRWNSVVHGQLEHVHLGMRFYPIGNLGTIGCRVHLAHQNESASLVPEYAVTVELRTDYEALRKFGASLLSVAKGESDEAILPCSAA